MYILMDCNNVLRIKTFVVTLVPYSWEHHGMPSTWLSHVQHDVGYKKWSVNITSLLMNWCCFWSKENCMLFRYKNIPSGVDIFLDWKKFIWVNLIRQLTYILTPDLKDVLDIQLEKGNFLKSLNGVCAKLKSVLISNDVIFYHDVHEISWPQPIRSLKLGHVIGQGPMSPTRVGRVSDPEKIAFVKSVKTWMILLYIWLHL